MILAAGRGTRLGQLGRTTPKVLVEVDGEPLLARHIRYLSEGGVTRIIINAHHLADQLERFVFNHARAANVNLVFERQLLGTAGGVRNALPLLGDEPFLVLYGDVLVNERVVAVCDAHRRARALATITVYETDEIDGKGTVELAPDRSVSAFHEKTGRVAGRSMYVNAGLYVIDPRFVVDLPLGVPLDFGRDVFPAALRRGTRIATYLLPEPVVDIGTPAALSGLGALQPAVSLARGHA